MSISMAYGEGVLYAKFKTQWQIRLLAARDLKVPAFGGRYQKHISGDATKMPISNGR